MGRPGKGKWPRVSRRTKCAQASVRKEGTGPGVGECARVTGSMSVGYRPPFFYPSFPPSFPPSPFPHSSCFFPLFFFIPSLPLSLFPPPYFTASFPIFSFERFFFTNSGYSRTTDPPTLASPELRLQAWSMRPKQASAVRVKASGYTLHQT